MDASTVTFGNANLMGTPIEAVGSGDATIAIRPDDLTPGADAPISAVVETAEYRGRDFYGTARTSDNVELFFRSDRKIASGETVRLGADPARVLVYARPAHDLPIDPRGSQQPDERVPLRLRLAQRGIDGVTLLVLPAALFILLLFVYPFLYGLILSVHPKAGGDRRSLRQLRALLLRSLPLRHHPHHAVARLAGDDHQRRDVDPGRHARAADAQAAPADDHPGAAGDARCRAGCRRSAQLPGSAGLAQSHSDDLRPDLLADPAGAQLLGRLHRPHHSQLPVHVPAHALLRDRHRPIARAGRIDARRRPRARFRYILLPLLLPGLAITFCLSFVQDFAVFPSAVLLGAPAGPTRVISLAAYQAAFEEYDYSMASAIAMIMGVRAARHRRGGPHSRGLFYRGPAGGGKG